MSAPAPVLAADLTAGLRRLKLAAMRELAPSLLVTAKTQRWTPEESEVGDSSRTIAPKVEFLGI